MDHHGDDDAGETSAVRSKMQSMKSSDQEIATYETCGHYPDRDWGRTHVNDAGQSESHKTKARRTQQYPDGKHWQRILRWRTGLNIDRWRRDLQVSHSTFSDTCQVEHDDVEYTCEMQRRWEADSNQGNCRVVEQTWRSGVDYQIISFNRLVFHDDVIKELNDFFWGQSNRVSSIELWFCVDWNCGERHQNWSRWTSELCHGSWTRSADVM